MEKNVTIGKAIDTSTVTFVIADLSRLWMMASIRQEDLGKLRVGQSATVTLPGDSAARFAGKITNLGQAFDPTTRVMQVRIDVGNANNRLRPEMLANADIPIGGRKPMVLVPSDAVQQVNGQDVVFVQIAPDRFAMRAVQVGEPVDGKTPVLEGLKGGEPVVVSSTFILKSLILKSTLESE
ncbi:MAG: efflux RND transporter periplasmic adaptor subunit [Acidobacteriota bacterium]